MDLMMVGRMKKLAECLCLLGLLGMLVLPAEAATQKKPVASASAKHAAKKAPVSKSRKQPASKSSTRAKKSTGTAVTRTCRTVKSHGKTKRVCSAVKAASAQALRSPISEDALDDDAPGKSRNGEIKARSVPDHAYAVDGHTFFYLGKKYRVAGLNGTGGSDMDKQRLQKALDAGSLTVDTVGTDDNGMSMANVTVNGQNLADQLR